MENALIGLGILLRHGRTRDGMIGRRPAMRLARTAKSVSEKDQGFNVMFIPKITMGSCGRFAAIVSAIDIVSATC